MHDRCVAIYRIIKRLRNWLIVHFCIPIYFNLTSKCYKAVLFQHHLDLSQQKQYIEIVINFYVIVKIMKYGIQAKTYICENSNLYV